MHGQLTRCSIAGLWRVGDTVPEHLPGGHRGGTHRPRAEARLHPVRCGLAGRRRAGLQHMALVDTQREKPTVWDYVRDGDQVHKDMDRLVAFNKGLTTWAKWVDANINPAATKVFFQGISPTHYKLREQNGGIRTQRTVTDKRNQ
ncbi:hypothetical protein MUK42_04062 [Musa troglodytarum]|uniref:Trichome birefringence-like C-terminal domain-containing protein n=1 Tax=Musa troglodytarum TaxID=320322 RepID=A0A9E7KMA0_9LILI|nr:hypothetical protein MUK42_04062 [Musa troglodytarum]